MNAAGDSSGSASILKIHTFGGLRILRGDEPVDSLASRKVEALLVYLACTGRGQPREVLADFLWDDFSQTRAMNNLRVVLSNLRKHLGDHLTITRDSVAMNPDSTCWLDVIELEAGLKAAEAQQSRAGELTAAAVAHLEGAVAHYQGEFLEGFSVRGSRGFDEWFTVERERLHRIVLDALGRLVNWHLARGQYMSGIEYGTRWLQLDPMMEMAHRQMMLLLAYSGQQGAALRQYEACVRVLAEELGVEPSAETTALFEQIQAGSLPAPEDDQGLASADAVPIEPPFKGLQYFEVEDADLFFGREQLTAKLVGRLRGQRFVAVVGASGSGKSSLVRAGLVPALMEKEPLVDGASPPAGSRRWPMHIITPTARPLEALAASLTRDADSVMATATLIDDLSRDSRILNLYVRKLLSQNGSDRLLLLVDQFEELFTLCRHEGERRAFVSNLLTAVADETAGPTIVVITLRADFYAHCAQYPELRAKLESHQLYIGQMGGEELRRAVEGPAHKEGYEFEPGLVDLLLRDIGAGEEGEPEPGALPLLSHTLLETWKRRQRDTMTVAAYLESGGVQGAIAQTAEQVYHQELKPSQQAIARNIFLRLTELGEGTQDTRRRAPLEELIPRPEDAADVEAVLKTLTDARLVTTAEGTAEVAHEALIREWPRLREWLDDGREGLRLHRQLTEAAQGWLELERDPGALYRGIKLARASEWAEGHASELNPLEREFLEASQAWERREEAEREAQQQRELALERQRAEEQAQAADQLRLRRRYLLGALAVASLLAVVTVFFGIQFRRSALEAEQQSRVALARELAGRSAEVLVSDPQLGLLLAIEAVNNTRQTDGFVTSEAEVALYRALASRDQRVLAGHADWIDAISFSPDGRRLVTASADGTARLWDLEGNHIATLEGHTDAIWSAAFSPDGERIVTSGDDGTARLWDAEGNLIITLEHPGGPVSVASFSPDGGRILTGSGDGTARLWDAKGNFLAALRGHTLDIQSAIFSPDGTRILTEGRNGRARLWDAEGSFIASLEAADVSYSGHIRGFYARKAVDFSPDGERIVTGSTDGPVLLWDIEGNLITILEGHTDRIWAARFSPNGEFIVTTSEDGTARLWDVEGNAITILEGHKARVWSIAFSPDGTQIVTGSTDGTARLWSIEGNPIATLEGHRDIVLPVTFSPDGKRVATGSFDRTARLWDVEGFSITRLTGHAGWVHQVTFHPDGERILTASVDGTARLWDMTGRVLQTFDGEGGEIWSAAFNQDGSQIVTAGDDGTIRQWDSDGALINVLGGHDGAVRWVDFSPAGDRMVTAGDDGSAHLWGSDGTLLATLEGHAGPLRSADFSPDGQHILTVGFSDFSPRLWDAGGNFLARLLGHELPVETAAFSADGEHIVTAGQDGTTKIWDIDGALLATLEVDSVFEPRVRFSADRARISDSVRSARFSPDGTRVLTGSDDNTARLWDLSGNLVATLEGHTGAVTWVEFSPGGGRIATASQDGTARLWNREGIFLAILEGHTGPVIWGNFSPDGTLLSTASEDGSVRVWQILESIDAMLATAEERVRRSLTEAECQLYLHRERCP